jgi:hypothetical protein
MAKNTDIKNPRVSKKSKARSIKSIVSDSLNAVSDLLDLSPSDDLNQTKPTALEDHPACLDDAFGEEDGERTVEALTPDVFSYDSLDPVSSGMEQASGELLIDTSEMHVDPNVFETATEFSLDTKELSLDSKEWRVEAPVITKELPVPGKESPLGSKELSLEAKETRNVTKEFLLDTGELRVDPLETPQKISHEELAYQTESTSVVPLSELVRREEARLRQDETQPPLEVIEDPQQIIPVGEIVNVLRATRSVEQVAGVLVEMVSNLIPRVLLLWERHGQLSGFASRGMDLPEVKLLTLEMPKQVLTEMVGKDPGLDSFRGLPRQEGMVNKFFEILGCTPVEVLLLPIQITGKDRWWLYADNGTKALPTIELRLLEVVAARAGAKADWLLEEQSIW